jgi:hypothetical protein
MSTFNDELSGNFERPEGKSSCKTEERKWMAPNRRLSDMTKITRTCGREIGLRPIPLSLSPAVCAKKEQPSLD